MDNKFEYPLLTNIFNIYHELLKVCQVWQHLEYTANEVMFAYERCAKQMEQSLQKRKVRFNRILLVYHSLIVL